MDSVSTLSPRSLGLFNLSLLEKGGPRVRGRSSTSSPLHRKSLFESSAHVPTKLRGRPRTVPTCR